MVIAAAKVVLDFWGNEEPRDKKKLIEILSQQLHTEFAIHLTEVESFDDLERCVLGLSFCAAERENAQLKVEKVLRFIDEKAAARVVSEDSDLIDFG